MRRILGKAYTALLVSKFCSELGGALIIKGRGNILLRKCSQSRQSKTIETYDFSLKNVYLFVTDVSQKCKGRQSTVEQKILARFLKILCLNKARCN